MFKSLSDLANAVDLVAVGMTVVMHLLLLAGTAMMYAVRLHGKTRKQEDVEEVAALDASDDTIFPLLQRHLVPMNVVEERGYSSVLSLVQVMIGTRPTCDMALEIWPPAFRAYNIIVPNFLNIPHMILGVPGPSTWGSYRSPCTLRAVPVNALTAQATAAHLQRDVVSTLRCCKHYSTMTTRYSLRRNGQSPRLRMGWAPC